MNTKKNKRKRSFNFGLFLLILAALVNTPRWMGIYAGVHVPILDMLTGASMGLVIALGLAFVFHRVGKMQPFTSGGKTGKRKPVMRFWIAVLCGVGILAISVYLLPPYVEQAIPESMDVGNPRLWSQLSVLCADLVVVMLASVDSKAAGFTAAGGKEPRTTRQPATTGKPGKVVSGKATGKSKKPATPGNPARVVTDKQIQEFFLNNPYASLRAAGRALGISHQALKPRVEAIYGADWLKNRNKVKP